MTVDQLPLLSAGLHVDIPEDTYHADRRTLSQSGAKLILKAPAKFRWEQDHPREYKAQYAVGTAAHKEVLGVGPRIIMFAYDETKISSPKATKAWKEQQAALGDREVLLTPDEFAQVRAMADKLSEHTLAMELLSEGRAEISAYAQDPDTQVWMRGRFDWLGARIISDYKTSTTADPDEFVKKAVDFSYDLQASWYLDLARMCGHPADGFAHIVQEKDPPYLVTVVVLPQDLLARGRRLKHRALERYRDCVEADLWPGYLPDTEFAIPDAPVWALRDEWN